VKCFSIDLDGTLLNSNQEISQENYKTLKYLKEQGHGVIINTGRAVEDVIKYEEIKQLKLPIISINGTVLYSDSGEVLYEASLPVDVYKQLLPILQEIGLWVMVYTNQGGFPFRNPEIQDKSDQILEKDDIKIYKLMAVARKDKLELVDKAKRAVAEKIDVSYASSHPSNVEFTSVEANKGTALIRYQNIMNLQFDEIYAFGDGGNDVEQFKVATTAVAMANAPDDVKKYAHLTTKTNDEHGFTYAVKELLKI
jgi:Cof subfamily protein (haloacid dehalogenase superfamily)